jgi:Tol biopolymer transport system component
MTRLPRAGRESRGDLPRPDHFQKQREGKRFTSVSASRDRPELWIVPVDALDASKGSTSLRWSANGQTLQFVAYPKGVPGLWEQPMGGGDPRLITHLPPGMTNSFLWYPDDRHLLVTSGNQTGDVVPLTNLR